MQPYHEATKEIRRQGELPLKAAKTIGNVGATAATAYLGGGVINRVLPFLSQYIPQDLVKKGLSKIDPRYGKFIDKALAGGQSIDEIKDFIGEKIKESPEGKPKEERNIIQQYSPELHEFIDQEVKKGRKPVEAGAIAQQDKRFSKIIDKLSKDHKTPWSNILESIYGQMGQMRQAKQNEVSSTLGIMDAGQQEVDQLSQPGNGQQGIDDQALEAAFAKLLKM
jgi:hypothetical protein